MGEHIYIGLSKNLFYDHIIILLFYQFVTYFEPAQFRTEKFINL